MWSDGRVNPFGVGSFSDTIGVTSILDKLNSI
jgi:hypothetical protein